MQRQILALVLAVISFNFLFLTGFSGHVWVGLAWLAIDLYLWRPELMRLKVW